MLVLKTVSREPAHGWAIADRIQQWSGQVFAVNQGTLYPALERLQQQGLIRNEWRITDNGRRARYYLITKAGLKRLEAERESWRVASGAIELILGTR